MGKTLIARAIAAETNCTFLKLAGPQLVQMFIGDGAKLVRDAFALAKVGFCPTLWWRDACAWDPAGAVVWNKRRPCLAIAFVCSMPHCEPSTACPTPHLHSPHRLPHCPHPLPCSLNPHSPRSLTPPQEKAPCIIFIDEIDAIGTKRFDSDLSGDREVQRTMLELLSQLDGFSSTDAVKIIAATNRPDILDPALVRSGRLDRKVEFPHPNEDSRAKILKIHARKMNVSGDVNYEELARSTDDFNAAMLKAVCVEAGMLALRR